MKRTLVAIGIMAILTTPAYAWGWGGNNDTYNEYNTTNNTTNNNPKAYGGRGGDGGDARAAAGAIAGAAAGANAGANASNRNSNRIGVGVGVGVRNDNDNLNFNTNKNSLGVTNSNANIGVNKNIGINGQRQGQGQDQSVDNTVLIGPSSQSLGNEIDNSNRNYMEGQRQGQDQMQGQGQEMGQSQSQGNKQNSSQSMTYNESEGVHYSGKYKIENTPSMGLGGIDPTVPCAIPLEGTYAGPGIGVGIGSAYVDKNCERRETVRLGFSSDNALTRQLANDVLQKDLMGYLEEADEVAVQRKKEAERVSRLSDDESYDFWWNN